MNQPSRVIAAVFALSGFTVAVWSGLIVDNPASDVLKSALIAMAVLYVVGTIVGALTESVVNKHIATTNAGGGGPAPSVTPAPVENSVDSSPRRPQSGGKSPTSPNS